MVTEIILALIAAVSTVIVALIQHRNVKAGENAKKSAEALRKDPSTTELMNTKRNAYDVKEDANDTLTRVVADYLLKQATLTDIEEARDAYIKCLDEYRKIKDKCLHHLESWINS